MAATVKAITTGNMAAATVLSVTSEATGYPKENVLDNNPDTYWKSTDGSVNQYFDFDLGSAKTVDTVVLWVHNYEDLTSSRVVRLYYSDDEVTYTFESGSPELPDSAGPLRIRTLGTARTHRYWRIIIDGDASSLAEVPEISGVWFGTLWQPTVGSRYPESDAVMAGNGVAISNAGRQFGMAYRSCLQHLYTRSFRVTTDADLAEVQGMFTDSLGRLRPVFLWESSTQTDAHMCYLQTDEMNITEIGPDIHDTVLQFLSVPYIGPGDSY